jgi:serine/threonine-protein kinase
MKFQTIAAGQTVSHYRLLDKLGEGGMGVVFAAADEHLGRHVAIKFLHPKRNGRMSRARFLREARAASILSHPNIGAIYDYGKTEDGRPYIIMELLRGRNLSDVLRAGSLSVGRTLSIIEGVLEALAEAHRNGIVHRDVKPSNIHIDERGQVKVLDFGLAKPIALEGCVQRGAAPDLPTQTLAGTVLGTPLYVSPEQATGAPVDQRGDLFAVGAILYECLAGRPAFAAPSVVEIFAQVISPEQAPPPSRHNRDVPPALDRVTLKALAKAPGDRYQSAEEFLEDLRRVPAPDADAAGAQGVLGRGFDTVYKAAVSGGHMLRSPFQRSGELTVGSVSLTPRNVQRLSLLLLLCGLARALAYVGRRTYMREGPVESIAVLPLVNETGDESIEYIGDGLTDALVDSLATVHGLKVISRGSTLKYKGRNASPAAVGADLGVEVALTGRITRANGQLEVAAELTDTRDGKRIWSKQYAGEVSDLLSVRRSLLLDVIDGLHLKLSDSRRDAAAGRPSVDPTAYDLYMKGRWYWNKMTMDNSRQAVSYFQQALDIDPGFALAHVGIAESYMLNSWVPSSESYMRARASVTKALELDPDLAEAHATLGFLKTHFERDWDGAEQEYRRAIELSPNSATAHHYYSAHLMARGRGEDFFREIRIAKELDPLSPIINADVGMYYVYKKDYDRAVEEFKRVGLLFPDFYTVNFFSAYAYTHKGMYPEAIAEYEKALALSKRHSLVLAGLGYTYAVAGRTAEARGVLHELEEMKKVKNVPPLRFAVVYAGLGDKDAAMGQLELSYEQQDIMLVHVNMMPFFDSLRGDPRFQDLIRRLGLTPP